MCTYQISAKFYFYNSAFTYRLPLSVPTILPRGHLLSYSIKLTNSYAASSFSSRSKFSRISLLIRISSALSKVKLSSNDCFASCFLAASLCRSYFTSIS